MIKVNFYQSQETIFIAIRTRQKDNRPKNISDICGQMYFHFELKKIGKIHPSPPGMTWVKKNQQNCKLFVYFKIDKKKQKKNV